LRRQIAARLQRVTGPRFVRRRQGSLDRLVVQSCTRTSRRASAARTASTSTVGTSGSQNSTGRRGRGRGRTVSFGNCGHVIRRSGTRARPPRRGGRFSRADLFTAILHPVRTFPRATGPPPLRRPDGKVYQGMVIRSVDSLILQTGPAATVRVVNAQIASRPTRKRRSCRRLLDKFSDRDLTDCTPTSRACPNEYADRAPRMASAPKTSSTIS